MYLKLYEKCAARVLFKRKTETWNTDGTSDSSRCLYLQGVLICVFVECCRWKIWVLRIKVPRFSNTLFQEFDSSKQTQGRSITTTLEVGFFSFSLSSRGLTTENRHVSTQICPWLNSIQTAFFFFLIGWPAGTKNEKKGKNKLWNSSWTFCPQTFLLPFFMRCYSNCG